MKCVVDRYKWHRPFEMATTVYEREICDAESGNRTRATLEGGEFSHHCAIPASQNSNGQGGFKSVFKSVQNSGDLLHISYT